MTHQRPSLSQCRAFEMATTDPSDCGWAAMEMAASTIAAAATRRTTKLGRPHINPSLPRLDGAYYLPKRTYRRSRQQSRCAIHWRHYGEYPRPGDYDPFPKSGLVKQYEPFIRSEVSKFCKRYPNVRRQDLLVEAIRLASRAEQLFKPELRQ